MIFKPVFLLLGDLTEHYGTVIAKGDADAIVSAWDTYRAVENRAVSEGAASFGMEIVSWDESASVGERIQHGGKGRFIGVDSLRLPSALKLAHDRGVADATALKHGDLFLGASVAGTKAWGYRAESSLNHIYAAGYLSVLEKRFPRGVHVGADNRIIIGAPAREYSIEVPDGTITVSQANASPGFVWLTVYEGSYPRAALLNAQRAKELITALRAHFPGGSNGA